MNFKVPYRAWTRPGLSFLGGILLVFALGGALRPIQNDLGHVVSIMSVKGGSAFHPANFELGQSLFGKFTIFLTGDVIPPLAGDVSIRLNGPEQLEYSLSSRYPPVVPLLNKNHPWYRFQNGKLFGVLPGDDLVVIVTLKPPKAPGAYELVLQNDQTGQVYLTVPVIFSPPGASHSSAAPSPMVTEESGEECH